MTKAGSKNSSKEMTPQEMEKISERAKEKQKTLSLKICNTVNGVAISDPGSFLQNAARIFKTHKDPTDEYHATCELMLKNNPENPTLPLFWQMYDFVCQKEEELNHVLELRGVRSSPETNATFEKTVTETREKLDALYNFFRDREVRKYLSDYDLAYCFVEAIELGQVSSFLSTLDYDNQNVTQEDQEKLCRTFLWAFNVVSYLGPAYIFKKKKGPVDHETARRAIFSREGFAQTDKEKGPVDHKTARRAIFSRESFAQTDPEVTKMLLLNAIVEFSKHYFDLGVNPFRAQECEETELLHCLDSLTLSVLLGNGVEFSHQAILDKDNSGLKARFSMELDKLRGETTNLDEKITKVKEQVLVNVESNKTACQQFSEIENLDKDPLLAMFRLVCQFGTSEIFEKCLERFVEIGDMDDLVNKIIISISSNNSGLSKSCTYAVMNNIERFSPILIGDIIGFQTFFTRYHFSDEHFAKIQDAFKYSFLESFENDISTSSTKDPIKSVLMLVTLSDLAKKYPNLNVFKILKGFGVEIPPYNEIEGGEDQFMSHLAEPAKRILDEAIKIRKENLEVKKSAFKDWQDVTSKSKMTKKRQAFQEPRDKALKKSTTDSIDRKSREISEKPIKELLEMIASKDDPFGFAQKEILNRFQASQEISAAGHKELVPDSGETFESVQQEALGESFEREKIRLETKMKRMQEEIDGLRKGNSRLQKSADRAVAGMRKVEQEAEKKREELDKKTDEANRLRSEKMAAIAKSNTLQVEKDRADAEIKRLQERVTTLEDPTRGEVADGMRVDGQTSQEDARLKKENGDLWDRVSALTTDHASEIEESSKHRAEEIARIRRENDGRERTLEEEISRVLAELSETRQRNQGLEARGNAIEHENIRLGTENARLTRANAAGQGEFNSLREQSYHVSTELDSTRAELDSTRAELDVTRSTLYASQRENHDLRSGAGSGDFVKELLEKSNNPEALKKVITGMISDKEAASRAREALSTEVAELNEKLSQALAMNGEMAVKIGTLNSALNSTAPPTPRIEGGADADSISDKGSVAKHK